MFAFSRGSGQYYGSSHWEPATASWSWRVSQPKAEREEFEGGGARAARFRGVPGASLSLRIAAKVDSSNLHVASLGRFGARIRPEPPWGRFRATFFSKTIKNQPEMLKTNEMNNFSLAPPNGLWVILGLDPVRWT